MDKLKQRVKARLSKEGPPLKHGRSRLLVDSAMECAAQDASRKRSRRGSTDQTHFTRHARRRVTSPEEPTGAHTPEHSTVASLTAGAGDSGGEHTSSCSAHVTVQQPTTTATATTGGGPAVNLTGTHATQRAATEDVDAYGNSSGDHQPTRGVVRLSAYDHHGHRKRVRTNSHDCAREHTAASSRGGAESVGALSHDGDATRLGAVSEPALDKPHGGRQTAQLVSGDLATTINNGLDSWALSQPCNEERKRHASNGPAPVHKRARSGPSSSPQRQGADRASSTAITPDGHA